MKYYSKKKELLIENKTLNYLDKFTLSFLEIIKKYTSYVIVSGYVSILLGRSRGSEDVDLLIPDMSLDNFKIIFKDLEKENFECINTSNVTEAYEIWHDHAIKFCEKGKVIPHMEFKIISNNLQKYALDNKVSVKLNEKVDFFISPLELQIAFKLSLMPDSDFGEISSDKDFEDAKHIYEYFKDDLDMERLLYFVNLLKVRNKFDLLIK